MATGATNSGRVSRPIARRRNDRPRAGNCGIARDRRGRTTAVPPFAATAIDGTVLAFTLAVSLSSGLLFGSAPTFQIAWSSLASAFNEVGRSGGARRRGQRVRSAFLVVEIAMASVLLMSAGLVIRSLSNAMKVDPGFEAAHLLALDWTIPPTKYTDPNTKAMLFTEAVGRLKTVAGVRAAGAAQCYPLSGVCVDSAFMLADHPVASVVDIPTAASNMLFPVTSKR